MTNFDSPWYASDHVDPQQVQEDYYLNRAAYDQRRAEQDRVNRSQERSMEHKERKHRHHHRRHHHHHHSSSRRAHTQQQEHNTTPAPTAPVEAARPLPSVTYSAAGDDRQYISPMFKTPIWYPLAEAGANKPLPPLPEKSVVSEYRTPQQHRGPSESDYLQVPSSRRHKSRRHRTPEDSSKDGKVSTDKAAGTDGPSLRAHSKPRVSRHHKITADSSSKERVSKFHEGTANTLFRTDNNAGPTTNQVSTPDSKQKSHKKDNVSTSISKSIEKGRKRVANGIKAAVADSVSSITAAIRERNFDARAHRRQTATETERQRRALFSYSDATFTCTGVQGDESEYRCLVCGAQANPALIHGYCMDCIKVVTAKEKAAAEKAAREDEQVRAAISGMLKLDTRK